MRREHYDLRSVMTGGTRVASNRNFRGVPLMIIHVFFLATAGDSIVYWLKNLLRPISVALRPSGWQLKALYDWIGPRSR
jgi:hypothetical protein